MALIATLALRDAAERSSACSRSPRFRARAASRSHRRSRPAAHEPAVQLREASSYRYMLDLPSVGEVRLEPAELFDPDDSSGMTGRLHTRQYVGDVS